MLCAAAARRYSSKISSFAAVAFLAGALSNNNSNYSLRFVMSSSAINDKMKAAQFKVGGPEQLFTAVVDKPQTSYGQAIIKVLSTSVNRADTLQRRGLYPPPVGESDILGLEAAGVICDIQDSHDKWKVGQAVMALLPGGGNAQYATVNVNHIMPIPKSVSMTEAGGIPEVWLTAYQLLHFVGQMKSSDKVLIHAGASGVGTAAVQLVKLHGATPIVTAGSAEKIKFALGLGAAAGFNYKTEDWVAGVKAFTNASGVDLVLDCVGASYWQKHVESIAVDGRWVLYGLMGGAHVDGNILAGILRKRINLLGSTLRARDDEYKARLIHQFTHDVLPHFDDKTLKPVVQEVFTLDDISKAHELMESNSTIGKILITVDHDHDEL